VPAATLNNAKKLAGLLSYLYLILVWQAPTVAAATAE